MNINEFVSTTDLSKCTAAELHTWIDNYAIKLSKGTLLSEAEMAAYVAINNELERREEC